MKKLVIKELTVRGAFDSDDELEIAMAGFTDAENYYEYLTKQEVLILRDHLDKLLNDR